MPFGIPFDIRRIIPTKMFAYFITGILPYYNFGQLDNRYNIPNKIYHRGPGIIYLICQLDNRYNIPNKIYHRGPGIIYLIPFRY
jgi:hypothetical protein